MKRDDPGFPATLAIERAALFVSLDGAILPVADKVHEVKASAVCRIVLGRTRDHLRGRFAVLSHRTIASIDAVLGGVIGCVSGANGAQRRTPLGHMRFAPERPRLADAAAVLNALARARHGLVVEDRGSSVSIDYRDAADAEAAVLEAVDRLAGATGLIRWRGNLAIELRAPPPDKGSALGRFMYEVPFSGAVPVFLGSHPADETAFVEASRRGGVGILVGAARATRATRRLDSHVAALSWIMRSLDRGFFDFRETRGGPSLAFDP